MGYLSLFNGSGKANTDEGLDIARSDFPGGYAIYSFNLVSDSLNDYDHFSLAKNASLRCSINFAQPLPNTVNVICYAEFEQMLEIDKNRNIIFDYAN